MTESRVRLVAAAFAIGMTIAVAHGADLSPSPRLPCPGKGCATTSATAHGANLKVCATTGATADATARGQQSVFRSGVDGVTIQASVRRNNRPVAGLTTADFALLDNGVPQEVRTLSVETVPVDITVLLDLSTSVDGPLLQRLKTAVSDTAALLREGDRIRLVAISQVLHEVFDLRPRGAGIPLDTLRAEGATSLYDGLAATMMHPTEPGRRQLIVAFTDGRDSASIIDEDTARAIARLTDTVVDIVVPTWNQPGEATRRLAQRSGSMESLTGTGNIVEGRAGPVIHGPDLGYPPILADLVAPTAGQVVLLEPGDSISRGFGRMLDDFRASYVLQYVPQGVAPSGWHDVTVSVTKGGKYDVRARKGYRRQGTIPPPVSGGSR